MKAFLMKEIGRRPIRRQEGYLPLEDLGLIGDGTTAGLVGLDGSIPWMRLPGYRQADVTEAAEVARVVAGDDPIAVYLALPPALVPHAVTALHDAGLPPGSRIVLEKPFGEDLESARGLNRLLADLVPEEAVFRVDHFLAMRTVQDVLGGRLANRVLEPGRLLLDVLRGDPALSIRGDDAEQAWRVPAPVLSAWERDLVPLREYPAGSDRPAPRPYGGGRRHSDLLRVEAPPGGAS
ncbi:hypothetical protein ACZ90_45810 [Streptomyces albus subsp. albus]|nr:hypothetical protein ACZ90_45810 [Streptomyces albus subsp. albus]